MTCHQVLKQILLWLVLPALVSCQKIEAGQNVAAETVQLVKSLGLLSPDEQLVLYYSNFKPSRAGSFFTNKRIAHYWLDERPDHNRVESAFYPDIVAITPQFNASDFDCPYLEITNKNGTSFRAYMDGSSAEKKLFFEQAVATWRKVRTAAKQTKQLRKAPVVSQ